MEKKKIHYIYKITLLKGNLCGHYYIGKHTTSYIGDGYCGSGTIIKNYFKKYRRRNRITYTKEILEYNETMEKNAIREKEIIGELYDKDEMCLNLKEGGFGGKMSEETKNKMEKTQFKKGNIPWNKGAAMSDEQKQFYSNLFKGQPGRVKSIEEKNKIAESKKIPIIGYDFVSGDIIGKWDCAKSAEKELGITHSLISRVVNNKRVQTHGIVFKKAG